RGGLGGVVAVLTVLWPLTGRGPSPTLAPVPRLSALRVLYLEVPDGEDQPEGRHYRWFGGRRGAEHHRFRPVHGDLEKRNGGDDAGDGQAGDDGDRYDRMVHLRRLPVRDLPRVGVCGGSSALWRRAGDRDQGGADRLGRARGRHSSSGTGIRTNIASPNWVGSRLNRP